MPANRRGAALIYNPDVEAVVLTGNGITQNDDLWEWNGERWTQRLFAQAAPARYGSSVAYDAARHQLVQFGGRNSVGQLVDETYLLEYQSYVPVEACTSAAIDYDNDGLAGCADPECWSTCTPLCPPGTSCSPSAPQCGDSVCDSFEDCRICPGDCGTCAGVCGDFECNPGETATCATDCP